MSTNDFVGSILFIIIRFREKRGHCWLHQAVCSIPAYLFFDIFVCERFAMMRYYAYARFRYLFLIFYGFVLSEIMQISSNVRDTTKESCKGILEVQRVTDGVFRGIAV